MNYLVKRYAPLLTKYDVQHLFKLLVDHYGTISEAADKAGIQRKTVYDWEKYSEDVKLDTKEKVLAHALEIKEANTIEFLINKTDQDLSEVTEHYIRTIYEKAMEATEVDTFAKCIGCLNKIQEDHRSIVFDHQFDTIEEMTKMLAEKAKEFRWRLPKRSTRLIPPEILVNKLLPFLEITEEKKYTVKEFKKRLDLPNELIDQVCMAINYYDPGQAPVRSTSFPHIHPPKTVFLDYPSNPKGDLCIEEDYLYNENYTQATQLFETVLAAKKIKE